MIFGVRKLERVSDWEEIVSPKNWVPGHSAFELAHKWHMTSAFPPAVARVLCTQKPEAFAGIHPEFLIVEMPTFLDTTKAPSWTDIMVHARNKNGERIIIGVEGKAKEYFGDPVWKWVRDNHGRDYSPKQSRMNRLHYLSQVLGYSIPADSDLRYQLLHRTVATVLEGEKAEAIVDVVLVHSFEDSREDNWNDFKAFLGILGIAAPEKNVVVGPAFLGSRLKTPTFFAWISDEKTANKGIHVTPEARRP